MKCSQGDDRRFRASPGAITTVIGEVWRHPANSGHRMRSLSRLAFAETTARVTGRPVAVPFGRNSIVLAHLHAGGSWRAVYANPPDHAEMTAWSELLTPGDTFVDIGANAGLYTVWAMDLGAEVVAVEPSATMMNHLKANVAINDGRVETVECGVSDAPGTAWLGGPDHLRNRLSQEPGSSGDGATRVTVSTVDTILAGRRARGMKVDVEGYERKVLEGASRSLSENLIDVIQLEWNDTSSAALGEDRQPVAALLHKHGYRLCRPTSTGLLVGCDDTGFGADMFAVSSTRAADLIS